MSDMDSRQPVKRKRGRPRKNAEKVEPKPEQKKEKKDENIVLFLALSDEESNDSEEDNRFTVNDDTATNKGRVVESLSDSDESDEVFNVNNKQLTVKTLIEEIKKRDAIIANLRSKGGSVLSSYNSTKHSNINYHCVQVANMETGKEFVPTETECKCWWCDETFDNLPAYIVNYLRGGVYYVFGNFCSFNCALKYNIKMLKDFKCNTRHALTNNLRIKVTGETGPIKLAGDRELLRSKGGKCSVEKFREGFSVVTSEMRMNIPPIIPLVHVIEEGRRD
ncbi:hypothetical protein YASMINEVIRUS_723 [Yasminevirus sp. GU-2018]|uniref:MYM-type domain-containing protein n=1 Tax=Yasminevirus sp. GU-2018 TaxID=2420051 RepID=A0A5K0U8W9_9VIRU|nr:hypothetical protein YASMINEVIRUS_723 [Yasminevirus sp. GU-2018]